MTAPNGQEPAEFADPHAEEGIGCRPLAITAGALLLIAAVLWTSGLLLVENDRCMGACSWAGFALIFAGGPVSAVFTVLGGSDIVFGWPVDTIAWMLIGSFHLKRSGEAGPTSRTWWRVAAPIVVMALVYGAVMATLVERVS